MEIKINPDFQKLIPPLSSDERDLLEKNILQDGCRDALVVWDGILLDGHNRLEICKAHNIPFNTVQAPETIRDQADARIWIRNNQKGRRNLTPAWMIELELGNKEDLLVKGREKQAQTLKQNASVLSPGDKTDTLPHNTQKAIAQSAGVSTGQVGMAEVVRKKSPELWEQAMAGDVTIGAAYKTVKKIKKKRDLEQAKKRIAAQIRESPQAPTIVHQNAIPWLSAQPSEIDLLITDPPYMTDVDNIQEFANSWLKLALSKLNPTGRAYVFIGAYPEEIAAYTSVEMPDQILVWTYRNTLGPSPKHNYKLNWQAILYYRMPDAPPLDCPIMAEQFSVQDINAPDGRQGDKYHTWQKPDEIAERFIRHGTKEGDIVCDPFAGTGTFVLAASKLGRKTLGCDVDIEILKIAKERGCKIE